MPIVGTVSMPSTDKRWYTINYPWLGTTERVVSATATVTGDDANFVIHQTVIANGGLQVQVLGSGGTEGVKYLIAVSVTTSNSQATVDHIEITVDNGGV